MLREDFIKVALGKKDATLVIKGGKLVNVNTAEIYQVDVAIYKNRVAKLGDVDNCTGIGTRIIDAKGKYLVPGFIDGHVHVESSMLSFTEFSKIALQHGTTAVASDLHEVGIVAGMEGIKELLQESKQSLMKLLWVVPSHVPFSPGMETTGGKIGPDEIKEAIKYDEAVGLSEILVFPVLNNEERLIKAIDYTINEGKTLEGHAPATVNDILQAYASVGIRSDHESTNLEEALEKVRAGLKLMIREGSASKDLKQCIKVITEEGIDTRNCMFVTDDTSCLDLKKYGHIDYKIRMAIQEGVPLIQAYQMATINVAESFKVEDEIGSISPGRLADINILSDLKEVEIVDVISKGKVVVEENKVKEENIKSYDYPEEFLNTINLKDEVLPVDLAVKSSQKEEKVRVRVIDVKGDTLLTGHKEVLLDVDKDSVILPDPERDILYISVVERHKATGNIFTGFISGFNISDGAFASTICHDHHNITAVGTNPEDMAIAINRLQELNGGIVIVRDGKVIKDLSLPLFGLISLKTVDEIAFDYDELQNLLSSMGCNMDSPFMTLSFVTLAAIPRYGITDKGLIDVETGKFVSLVRN